MIYDVEFSLDAAAELLRIAQVVGSASLVLRAADEIRRRLEDDPTNKCQFLSEGLYYIDEAFEIFGDKSEYVVAAPQYRAAANTAMGSLSRSRAQ